MFHEHREIVTELKTTDTHFKKVFDAHNDLHDKLDKADHIDPMEIERMKKEKLKLKDEAYAMIMDHKNK